MEKFVDMMVELMSGGLSALDEFTPRFVPKGRDPEEAADPPA